MSQKQIRVPMGIPLIGQGPTPEQVANAHNETMAVFKTWPVHAYPTGQQAGPFWGGETMLHRFATVAMEMHKEQFSGKGVRDEVIIQLAQKCWKIAIIMMKTAPFGVVQDPNQEKADAESPATTAGAADAGEPGSGAFPLASRVAPTEDRQPLRTLDMGSDR